MVSFQKRVNLISIIHDILDRHLLAAAGLNDAYFGDSLVCQSQLHDIIADNSIIVHLGDHEWMSKVLLLGGFPEEESRLQRHRAIMTPRISEISERAI